MSAERKPTTEEPTQTTTPGTGWTVTPPFDRFPYLVTRIGHTPLRHISLLPVEWSRERLLEVARRQVLANRLDTCLCLGPGDCAYLDAEGGERFDDELPTGIPLMDRLHLPEPVPVTPELAERRARLEEFVERHRATGYIVGDNLEGGRPASEEDLRRLAGRDEQGVPRGLTLCPTCENYRGEYLFLPGPSPSGRVAEVLAVHCICQNHNRCARCGRPLAPRRLSAYSYRYPGCSPVYLAAYAGLSHHCPSAPG